MRLSGTTRVQLPKLPRRRRNFVERRGREVKLTLGNHRRGGGGLRESGDGAEKPRRQAEPPYGQQGTLHDAPEASRAETANAYHANSPRHQNRGRVGNPGSRPRGGNWGSYRNAGTYLWDHVVNWGLCIATQSRSNGCKLAICASSH